MAQQGQPVHHLRWQLCRRDDVLRRRARRHAADLDVPRVGHGHRRGDARGRLDGVGHAPVRVRHGRGWASTSRAPTCRSACRATTPTRCAAGGRPWSTAARSLMPLERQMWGDDHGQLVDKFHPLARQHRRRRLINRTSLPARPGRRRRSPTPGGDDGLDGFGGVGHGVDASDRADISTSLPLSPNATASAGSMPHRWRSSCRPLRCGSRA